jgi:tRNA(fMet)-specific endonuclease VapC
VSFLVDTDICSAHLKQSGKVTARFVQYMGRLHVSAVTVAELFTWALRAKAPPQRLRGVLDMVNDMTFVPVDQDVARKFGELRAALLDAGQPKPQMDLLIAATALVHGMTLVTHNTRDYMAIPGLTLDDWLVPYTSRGQE